MNLRNHVAEDSIAGSSAFSFKIFIYRGVEQLVARWAHNPKAVGSNPTPATTRPAWLLALRVSLFYLCPTILREPPPFIIYGFCKPCWMIIHSDTTCLFISGHYFQRFDRYSDRCYQNSLIFRLLLTMPNIPYLSLPGAVIKESHSVFLCVVQCMAVHILRGCLLSVSQNFS